MILHEPQPRKPTKRELLALQERTTAIALVRVSTDEQAIEGVSLAAQRDAVTAEAERLRLTLDDVVMEEGTSGKTMAIAKRPKLAAVLARLDSTDDPADCLIVQRLDRLSRRLADIVPLLVRADKHGWSLIVISPSLDSARATDRVFFHLLGTLAEQERTINGARTKDGMARARKDGAVLGRTKTARSTVRLILGLHGDGKGWQAIADRLTADGVPTTQGGARWHPTTVRRIHDQNAGLDLDEIKWVGQHDESESEAIARLAAKRAQLATR
jgi:DNA invertase Pin-like site-specific DNA recombinase